MHVVVVSAWTGDSCGHLDAAVAAGAVVDGWSSVRPNDDLAPLVVPRPGGGFLDAVAAPTDHRLHVEVAGPEGHPVDAEIVLRPDGTAVVEAARASGPGLLANLRRTPVLATTYGVGQLLDAARRHGARRVVVAVGDVAAVDGGAGALTGLGFRLTVGDGSGLKIGGDDLGRVAGVARGWSADWGEAEVVVLADTAGSLGDAATHAGPLARAGDAEASDLAATLARWADVVEHDLEAPGRRAAVGTGAGGGLAFGLACALPTARVVVDGDAVAVTAELVGAAAAVAGADLVVVVGGDVGADEVPGWLGEVGGAPTVHLTGGADGSDLSAAAAHLASRRA